MANKVGSVYIEASVDTTGVIQAGKAIGVTADNISADLNSIGSTAGALNTRLSKTSESVRSSVGNMSGSFAQAGVQFQQFVGQVQGGTSALTALSQQGADLGIVLGAPLIGVIVSLAAAIGGVLYNSIEKTKGSMSALPDELQKYLKAVEEQYAQLDEVSRAEFAQAEIGKITTAYQKTAEEVTSLTDRLAKLKKFGLIGENIDITTSLPEQIKKTGEQLDAAKKRAESFTQILNELGRVTTTGLATDKVGEGIDEGTAAAERLQAQLKIAIERMTEGELAARRMAAAQILGLKAGEQLDAVTDNLVVKAYELEQIEKRKTEQNKLQLELQRESRAELDRELQAELAAIDAKNKAQAFVGDIASGGDTSQEAKVAAQAESRIATIQQYADQELITAEQAAAAITDVELQKQAELTRIANEGAEKRKQFSQQATQSTLGAFGDLFGNLADVAKEGGEKTFKQYKMLASAQAAISAALAITNVLANPLIPYPLNVGLAASVGALAGVQIAKIQSQQYSAGSGKLYGGPVQAGGMYPVTEDGRPEILKQGNRQYLLPGSRGGEVISNKDMQGVMGGGGTIVNINNYTGENVTQSRQQGPSGQEIINVVVGDINRRGQIHSAITRNTTAGNRST